MALLSKKRVYSGRRISVDLDEVRFPDGSVGKLEMVRHPGASAVIPFLDPLDAPDPRIVLIRQYRWAAEQVMWEVPAGTLDKGEAPADCAHRELREEAGVEATELRHLVTMFTTPGFTDEQIHLYAATGLTTVPTAHEADEFIETREVRWSEVGRMIRDGRIRDGKTLVALMWVSCFAR
jgi:ADP-ribose pyrophosphatase